MTWLLGVVVGLPAVVRTTVTVEVVSGGGGGGSGVPNLHDRQYLFSSTYISLLTDRLRNQTK